MTKKIIPNVVGVDIGCGLLSINLGSFLPLSLQELDHKIRQQIPFGFNVNDKSVINIETDFPWKQVNTLAQKFAIAYQSKFSSQILIPKFDFKWFEEKCKIIGCDLGRAIKGLSSLGGGNHFCEIGLSSKNEYWLTIHTGSRNFGKCICDYWQNIAIKKLKKNTKEDRRDAITNLKITLKGRELFEAIKTLKAQQPIQLDFSDELCYLENSDAHGYLSDMIFSQTYAHVNRNLISQTILRILKLDPIDSIETVHNFIDFEDFIIRKGAIRSYLNERMVIPFNMRDGILICLGKSNNAWNFSAPHGAGRLMSRSQAKKNLNMSKFQEQMTGIFSTSVCRSTLDEAPDAYKDSQIIEEAIQPTAEIIGRIKPILNLKDSEDSNE